MKRETPPRFASASRESGSALIAAMIVLVILTSVAASVFMSSMPAYRGTYQASAWHEAKLAADAGVDFAMAALQKTTPDPRAYDWAGWSTDPNGAVAVPANFDGVRYYVPPDTTLVQGGDGSTKPRILRVEVDVITRDDNFAQNAWYRIRSVGLADVPSTQLSLDKRDLTLRRMTLQKRHITRTVEVMSRPVYLWEYALKTSGSMVLGGGTDWKIDSYDSRTHLYPERSVNGIYDSSIARSFGNIASNLPRPEGSPYGVLIDAEGAVVRGEVQTRGGDNPDTIVHENVEESQNIDQARITDEYYEVLSEEPDPSWYKEGVGPTGALTAPAFTRSPSHIYSGNGTVGSTYDNPAKFVINANGGQALSGFEVVNDTAVYNPTTGAFTPGTDRFVEIWVNGDIDLGGSSIKVQKNVHVKIYLYGNLNFRNQDINYVANTAQDPNKRDRYSMRPSDLLIFGKLNDGSTPAPRVDSSGNGHIVAAFYGPQYLGNLDGNTEIMGAFVLKSYNIAGGGGSGGDSLGAGFHYDEALGVVGPVKYYKAVSYFEDTRRDLE